MGCNCDKYVIGVDYGTDSVRSIVVNALSGEEMASSVAYYQRWMAGKYCDPAKNQFRQHPLDYIESLESSIRQTLAQLAPEVVRNIVGIGIDTTGSTPCLVNKDGTPLALTAEMAENPNAMFILWKDHTSVSEAERINTIAHQGKFTDYTKYCGGVYSSEWFWAKMLHLLREDERIREKAYSCVEHCDWIPALLTGTTSLGKMKRSRCAAGHKAMWHQEWGGLPPQEFFTTVDPLLSGIREHLYQETYTSDNIAGELTEEWASRLGLTSGVKVAVGAFDAHMGAVGGGIVEGALVKIMGTSTCDVMIASKATIGNKLVGGICGQVDGSVIPGMVGLEAGQSSYGDVYAWFKNLLSWPLEGLLSETTVVDSQVSARIKEEVETKILQRLTQEAEKLDQTETDLLSLDWLNGRRTPYADQRLKGAILGITLGTTAPKIFKSLAAATAFGAKSIVDRFREEGVAVNQIIALGGIAGKNPFIMQLTADILNMPIKVVRSGQACALGAAIFGATAAGIYASVSEASYKMSSDFSSEYYPRAENVAYYQGLYNQYLQVGHGLEEELRLL